MRACAKNTTVGLQMLYITLYYESSPRGRSGVQGRVLRNAGPPLARRVAQVGPRGHSDLVFRGVIALGFGVPRSEFTRIRCSGTRITRDRAPNPAQNLNGAHSLGLTCTGRAKSRRPSRFKLIFWGVPAAQNLIVFPHFPGLKFSGSANR